ncbi:MAG: tetratricopeptide repeat protein [Chloroflexi bacterium]|nr:MAG: tetratricopeptide repeat protein [Chloroflexota bacterium]MBL1194025.1 tetratricopeptide repeat protein [Chloroflexota bacterium]NOH11319.1 tetratricopeptide repeat protein [Chloroflexota bacterium]
MMFKQCVTLHKSWFSILLLAFFIGACAAPPTAEEDKSLPVLPTLPTEEEDVLAPPALVVPEEEVNPIEESSGQQSPQELLEAGNAAEVAGDLESALGYYDLAIQTAPEYPEAYYTRARLFADLAQPLLAIEDYNRAIELQPQWALAFYGRGVAYFNAGDGQQAVLDLSEAIRIDPTIAEAYRDRAIVERGLYLPESVIADLQVYLALAPDAEDRPDIEALIGELEDEILRLEVSTEGLPFFDDFSDNLASWFDSTVPELGEVGEGKLDSGGYRITVDDDRFAIWARTGASFTDIAINVDATKVGGDDDNFYGVICRYQNIENFYALLVSSDGFYGIAKRLDGGSLEAFRGGLEPSDVINKGSGTNRIRAVCAQSTIKLYVNDVLLMQVTDSSIPFGDVAMIAGTYDVPGTDILFDNWQVEAALPTD